MIPVMHRAIRMRYHSKVFGNTLRRLRRAQRPIIRGTQWFLLNLGLFFLYYIGFGVSRLVMTVLANRTLYNRPRRRPDKNSFWRETEGYELSEAQLPRQS